MELWIGAQQLIAGDSCAVDGARGKEAVEGVGDGIVEALSQGEVCGVELIHIAVDTVGELATLGADVAELDDGTFAEVVLEVEAVVHRIAGGAGALPAGDRFPSKGIEAARRAEGLVEAAGERVAQEIGRRETAAADGGDPRGGGGEAVHRGEGGPGGWVVVTDAGAHDQLVGDLIGDAEAGCGVDAIGLLEVAVAVGGELKTADDGASRSGGEADVWSGGVEPVDAVVAFCPAALVFETDAVVEGEAAGDAPGVLEVGGEDGLDVGGLVLDGNAAAGAGAEKEGGDGVADDRVRRVLVGRRVGRR